MDVVRTNVEKIGGQIDIQSRLGAGSVFRLQIPLSLAVIDGLVVHADGARYVLPLSQVQETLNLAAQKALGDYSGTGVCFELRGQVVPVFSINEALGLKKNSAPRGTGLIIKVQERLVALSVDEIVRSQQIVIKPLGNGLPTRQGWIGTCVLGDGQPTLIVSPSELLEGRVHANSSPRSRSEAA
jgi:two-component system chemotaxis sensor kinase CheA